MVHIPEKEDDQEPDAQKTQRKKARGKHRTVAEGTKWIPERGSGSHRRTGRKRQVNQNETRVFESIKGWIARTGVAV